MINNNTYNGFYLLTDGIYPEWKIFVQTISEPLEKKHQLFAKKQEGARKDGRKVLWCASSKVGYH